MCRRVDCRKCGRPTFAGCGMHVEQVLGNVPPSQRCRCHEEADEEGDKEGDVERDEERAAKETTAAGTAGFFSRLKDLIGK